MTTFVMDSVRGQLQDLGKYVVSFGEVVSPRGMRTYEVRDVTLILNNPWDALPVGIGRRLNTRFAAVEAIQLVGGFSDPHLMAKAMPGVMAYANFGTFHGAYGPRVREQLPLVVRRLREDPDSRRAVVNIWDWSRDLTPGGDVVGDFPCTCLFQFRIRGGCLELATVMRSNDLWRGWSFDAFQFTQLQQTVANVLGVPAGRYYHHALSLHVYDTDVAAINELHDPTGEPVCLTGFTGRSIEEAQERARVIASGSVPDDLTGTEAWYVSQIEAALRS